MWVKHLTCACTGMPRQDLEWLLEFKDLTPEGALVTLGKMQPTSKFAKLALTLRDAQHEDLFVARYNATREALRSGTPARWLGMRLTTGIDGAPY